MQGQIKVFEFHYASFGMKPYGKRLAQSSKLLKEIFSKLRDRDFPPEKAIIDRFENRKGSEKRRLVIISTHYEDAGRRLFGKIALIKNKAPLIWNRSDIVEEIEKDENKEFIEVTNYAVNFNENSDPVVMLEYNHEGPRLSDFEFYIRQIAKEFRIAKNISYSLHLNTNYSQLDKEISNIFAITVKVNASAATEANWLAGLKGISTYAGYKDVRLEFFYNRYKGANGKYKINRTGTSFAKQAISWLRKDSKNIEYLDDLKMTYQVEGSENVVDLDFIRNKVVSVVEVPLVDGRVYKNSDFKHHVGTEFNKYLSSGKTTRPIV